MRAKLNEANASVQKFEERLHKQVGNEEQMKSIVDQLKDYLYVADEENRKLKDTVEELKTENEDLKRNKIEQESLTAKLKEKEREREATSEKLNKTVIGQSLSSSGSGMDCSREINARYEAMIRELTTEKMLLEQKIRSSSLGEDERSQKILQLTESNKRLSQDVVNLQKKFDLVFDEKMKLENDLGRKRIEYEARDGKMAAFWQSNKELKDKLAEQEEQISVASNKLRLSVMANERVELERSNLDEALQNANCVIQNLENKISMYKANTEKYEKEMKVREAEIMQLIRSCDAMEKNLEETAMEKEMLERKLASGDLKASRFDDEAREARDMKERLHRELAKYEEENSDLLLKVETASKLMAEAKKAHELKEAETEEMFDAYKGLAKKFDAVTSERDKEKDKATKAFQKLKRVLDVFHEEDRASKERLSVLEVEQVKLKEELREIGEVNSQLEQIVNEANKQLESSEQNYKAMKKALQKSKNDNQKLIHENRELQDVVPRLQRLEGEIKNQHDLILTGEKQVEALIKDKKELTVSLQERESELGKLRDALKDISAKLESTKTERANLDVECKHLRSETAEIHKTVTTLESEVKQLEELNSLLNVEKNNYHVNIKNIGSENQRLWEIEKDLRAQIVEKVKEIDQMKGEVENVRADLKDELCKERESCKKLRIDFDALKEANEDLKMKHQKKKTEAKKTEQEMTNLQKENEELNQRNLNKIKELEGIYEAMKSKADIATTKEQDYQALAKEYKILSTELLRLKATHSRTLSDALNQKYLMKELSGNNQYEHTQRKRLEIEVETKDKELAAMQERLVSYENEAMKLEHLVATEKSARIDMQKDLRKFKEDYEMLERNKSKVEDEMKKKISELQRVLAEEANNCDEITCELQMKNSELNDRKREIESLSKQLDEKEEDNKRKAGMVKDLEEKLVKEADAVRSLAKAVNAYENQILGKENEIKGMQERNNVLEKVKQTLEIKVIDLEGEVRDFERKYNMKFNEEDNLREKLKVAKADLKQISREKECLEEQKHKLELKLLQVDFKYGRQNRDLIERCCVQQKHFVETRQNHLFDNKEPLLDYM